MLGGFGSNLPPGVRVSDLPGNTPEDEKWEALFLWLPHHATPEEVREVVERFLPPLRLSKGDAFADGVQEGRQTAFEDMRDKPAKE